MSTEAPHALTCRLKFLHLHVCALCASCASIDPLWQIAMKEKLDTLSKNHTWDFKIPPLEKSVVGCKWIYTIKTHFDGSIECYKARLIAKGFIYE